MVTLIKHGTIVNEGLSFKGSLLIRDEIIEKIISADSFVAEQEYYRAVKKVENELKSVPTENSEIIEAEKLTIFPGVIDDQVHLREPGGCAKADIATESRAAVLGGVTSFMDMPNNTPPATTNALLENKFAIAEKNSFCNYSFYLGATNSNVDEIVKADTRRICGIKVFMGSSTGNMLVNDSLALEEIFQKADTTIATHCEEEETIRRNMEIYKKKYGDNIPFEAHPDIRSREACIESTKKAVALALKYNSKLHVLHISTADEIEIIREARKQNPQITGEICVHYLYFNRNDFKSFGAKIKCNPALKEESDMLALRKALKEGIVKVVATDHAPHLESEKANCYTKAPSGLPLIQHSLQLMLELSRKGVFTKEEVARFMCHAPAQCFGIEKRGFIREGYYADLAIVDTECEYTVAKENIAYKCKWSPFEGHTFHSRILYTFINGTEVVKEGKPTGKRNAKRLIFK